MMQISFHGHSLKAVLAQSLIENDSGRIGQVQRTDIAPHGNPDAGIRIANQYLFGYAPAFRAEHQIIVRRIGNLGIDFFGLGRCQVEFCAWIFLQKFFKITVNL